MVLAANQACNKLVAIGLGREVLKTDVVLFEEEEAMLATPTASPDSPSGLNQRYVKQCCLIIISFIVQLQSPSPLVMFHFYRHEHFNQFLFH